MLIVIALIAGVVVGLLIADHVQTQQNQELAIRYLARRAKRRAQ